MQLFRVFSCWIFLCPLFNLCRYCRARSKGNTCQYNLYTKVDRNALYDNCHSEISHLSATLYDGTFEMDDQQEAQQWKGSSYAIIEQGSNGDDACASERFHPS